MGSPGEINKATAEVTSSPDVNASPTEQGTEFLRDAVMQFGQAKKWDDIFGSLP
jgi:hypothetical protein